MFDSDAEDDAIYTEGPSYFVIDLSNYNEGVRPSAADTAQDRATTEPSFSTPEQVAASLAGYEDRYFEADVETAIRNQLVREAAEQKLAQIKGQMVPELPLVRTLRELLLEDDIEQQYSVRDLWPIGGNVLFAAPAKWGKSSVTMNLVRSLVDGNPFLDHFSVDPIKPGETILVIDFEMSENRVRSEFRAQGIQNQDQVVVISLRGQASRFDVNHPVLRKLWVDFCLDRNVRTLILDPLAPLLGYFGTDENANTEINQFFQMLDSFKDEAGIRDLMAIHHCGYGADWRPRGASRFNDWPDAIWLAKIDGDVTDNNAPRLFFARGRDVGEEFKAPGAVMRTEGKRLAFDPEVSKSQAAELRAGQIENFVFTYQGLRKGELIERLFDLGLLPGQDQQQHKILNQLAADGRLHAHLLRSRGNPTHWFSDESRCTFCQEEQAHAD